MSRRFGRAVAAVLAGVVVTGGATATAQAAPSRQTAAPAHSVATPDCVPRLLILSAFPTELGPLLARTKPRGGTPIAVGDHTFYTGVLGGHRVVLTLTGIGPQNARRTTRMALSHFRCSGHRTLTGIVFSGVAGGDFIGDVNAATRWTKDGKHFTPVDKAMERVARRVQRDRRYHLSRDNHAGDPLCLHLGPDAGPAVTVTHEPTFMVGGDGLTTDPFGGMRLPCFPGGGDTFGCRPCEAENVTPPDPVTFLQELAPFVGPTFFTGYFSSTAPPPGHYVSSDEETAEVAIAAHKAGLPFIGFRGVSDGDGDQLHLPGFPFQFFVYRQLSADNAAAVAVSFIEAWHDRSSLRRG
jgi:nucleoside phosphorylase